MNIIYIGNKVTDSKPNELQSKATKKMALEALDALKALNVVQLDVRDVASFTDYMIFASGSSTRHVGAIAASVVDANPVAQWYETRNPFAFMLDGNKILTQLSEVPVAPDLATARSNISNW